MNQFTSEQNLQGIIQNSQLLSSGEKSILLNDLGKYTPLEKLKLRKDILQNIVPIEIVQLRQTKNEFKKQENPGKPDIITQITNKIGPKTKPNLLGKSLLQKSHITGLPEPVAINSAPANLPNLASLINLGQLNSLTPAHVSFNLNDNSDQLIRDFLHNLDKLFGQIQDISTKRNYLMNFLQSPLFNSYLNTGITALRHPEIQPSKVVLNTLNHIDLKYLNNKQFQAVAKISNHIRSLVAL